MGDVGTDIKMCGELGHAAKGARAKRVLRWEKPTPPRFLLRSSVNALH